LYAGKGGFDVKVKGNTGLKGGVLASDADASKNRFATGTVTTSDIENKAEYNSDSSSVSLSYSGGSSNPNGTITAPGGIKPDGETASGSALQTLGSNAAANAAGNAISANDFQDDSLNQCLKFGIHYRN
jgi:filamentous hemagglutinin